MNKNENGAQYIWDEQNRLNQRAHPSGLGTIEIGKLPDKNFKDQVIEDYLLAISSEINECQENCYWKHWSSEAKNGKRFQLINPDGESGEGTAQNVYVEIIDIGFFLVSILQTAGLDLEVWSKEWEKNWDILQKKESVNNPKDPECMRNLCNINMRLLGETTTLLLATENQKTSACNTAIKNYIGACDAIGLNHTDIINLYKQKLKKNHERMDRGRKQVGDTLAAIECAEVKK